MKRLIYILLGVALGALGALPLQRLLTPPPPPSRAPRPPLAPLHSPLAGLSQERGGRARRVSSYDRREGNRDYATLGPGQRLTLLDVQGEGAGVVRRFWLTLDPRRDARVLRQVILRMHWDGEAEPSVEAPLGDFFGVGFGEQRDFVSLPLSQTSGGFTCYWPMPFRHRARWTLENRGDGPVTALYYNIDYTTYDDLPSEELYFHAQWHREAPVATGHSYTALDARGRGHLVGLALFMQHRRGGGLGFLEGDEAIYIDGEARPSLRGTGTEDYFNGGWYFDRGAFSAPFHGAPLVEPHQGRISAYRWHLEDALPFRRSLRVTLEHGRGNLPDADYSSVAYWYQAEPHAPFPALPAGAAALLPLAPPRAPRFGGPGSITIEGEDLLERARPSSGAVDVEELAGAQARFSDAAQLRWGAAEGATLDLELPPLATGAYEIQAHLGRGPGGAAVRLLINDVPLGPARIDLYAPRLQASGPVPLGQVTLGRARARMVVSVVGKDPRSAGYGVGLDALVLSLIAGGRPGIIC